MSMLGFRCSDEIDLLVRDEASRKGITKSQLLNSIVKKNYSENPELENPSPGFVLDGRVAKIQEINNRIDELESKKNPIFNAFLFTDEGEQNDQLNEQIESLKIRRDELQKSLSIEKNKIKDALARRQKMSVNSQ